MKRLWGMLFFFTGYMCAELYEMKAMHALEEGDYKAFVDWFEIYTDRMAPQDKKSFVVEARKFVKKSCDAQLKTEARHFFVPLVMSVSIGVLAGLWLSLHVKDLLHNENLIHVLPDQAVAFQNHETRSGAHLVKKFCLLAVSGGSFYCMCREQLRLASVKVRYAKILEFLEEKKSELRGLPSKN